MVAGGFHDLEEYGNIERDDGDGGTGLRDHGLVHGYHCPTPEG